MLTSRQLANELNVSTQTVANWVNRGCPYSMVGIMRMFDPEKVKAWYDRYREETQKSAAIKRWKTIRENQVGK